MFESSIFIIVLRIRPLAIILLIIPMIPCYIFIILVDINKK